MRGSARSCPTCRFLAGRAADLAADGEFFNPREFEWAADLLREGRARAAALKEYKAPWTEAHGLVVRGHRSKLDDSIQPYGLVVPASYTSAGNDKFSLDFWFHGRGENLSEVNFLRDRQKNVGTFSPPDTTVLTPTGATATPTSSPAKSTSSRPSHPWKERYRIDDDRIVPRLLDGGRFDLAPGCPLSHAWAAANPGAGFAETPVFAKVFHKESLTPTWWETKLFHWYDATDWAENLWHCPTVAYSGEIDSQKQAANIMAEAMKRHGLELVHVIGPKTKHQYHPQARLEVDRRIASSRTWPRDAAGRGPLHDLHAARTIAAPGSPSMPRPSLGAGAVEGHADENGNIVFATENVQAFTISIRPATHRFERRCKKTFRCNFCRRWSTATPASRKCCRSPRSPRATAAGPSPSIGRGSSGKRDRCRDRPAEAARFAGADRRCVSRAVPVRASDRQIDPPGRRDVGAARTRSGHRPLAAAVSRFAASGRRSQRDRGRHRLQKSDSVGRRVQQFSNRPHCRQAADSRGRGPNHGLCPPLDAAHHVPILIYPNPLNPQRYVVLNSGFTFREMPT